MLGLFFLWCKRGYGSPYQEQSAGHKTPRGEYDVANMLVGWLLGVLFNKPAHYCSDHAHYQQDQEIHTVHRFLLLNRTIGYALNKKISAFHSAEINLYFPHVKIINSRNQYVHRGCTQNQKLAQGNREMLGTCYLI